MAFREAWIDGSGASHLGVMRRRSPLLVAVAAAWVLGARAGADEAKIQPVRPSEIDGRRLVFMGKLLTVEAPGDQWQWVRRSGQAGMTQYACRRADPDDVLVVMVMDSQDLAVDAEYARGLATGIVDSIVKAGGRAEAPEIAPSASPLPGS